ncbi:hypothetical protein [Sphingomonas bacterium]|uniref:hypothetical protein n=1 Tax=Sphingomonas bacterium TaxID=1895847 RepID=UPI001575AB91|nr:hypothetical protein [Sphingomonas bacterium]
MPANQLPYNGFASQERFPQPQAGAGAQAGTRAPARFAPLICFLIGLSVLVPIAPEARLTLYDLVAVGLVVAHPQVVRDLFGTFLALLVASLAFMALSVFINGSGMAALAGRGYPSVALFVESVGYCIVIRNSPDKGRAALVAGTMIGICCHYFYPNDLRVHDYPIKFLIGVPLGAGLLALYALASGGKAPSVAFIAVLLVGYAVFCFAGGTRSVGGVYFASAIVVLCMGFLRVPASYRRLAPVFIIGAAILGYGVTELYAFLAIKGLFGYRAAEIAIFQSSFGSILLGGRPEIIVNLLGIGDHPFIGVGIYNYSNEYLYDLISLSVYASDDVLSSGNILYHSALVATAFETGIPSAIVWLYLVYIAIFAVPLLSLEKGITRSFVAPLLLMTAWIILYSPPIPYNRFVLAIGVGLAFTMRFDWMQKQLGESGATPVLSQAVVS